VFRIDAGSGVPVYRQLVEQVRREVMLGRVHPGDQLPTLKEVVEALAINPNTVVKAYSELEHEGLVVRRQGVGTFIASTPARPLAAPPALLNSLLRWVRRARDVGMSAEQIRALVAVALDEDIASDAAPGRGGGVA
jgi:DNA-binding transcriptional regulator YhcF (GntR family)